MSDLSLLKAKLTEDGEGD
ncbi:hypothetical protein VTL71DRAFT_14445 [Oculimacula yallundae]|uniref:Uncharacterized protein n=1 Tax=Oculimacula yallundae TaxID=86028 RepID=A0ABR4CKK1_9HELO